MHTIWIRRAFFFFALLHPLLYFTMFAGDAEVHLVYAEQAAQGRWFVFNQGEVSAGVTSPGYLIFLATLFRVFPAFYIPLILKLFFLGVWLIFLWAFFQLLETTGIKKELCWLVSLLLALMPGIVYNASLGMENILFALIVVLLFWRHTQKTQSEQPRPHNEALLTGLLWGISCWIRPEGFVLGAIFYTDFLLQLRHRQKNRRTSIHSLLFGVFVFACVGGCMLLFHWACTGRFLPASGSARVMVEILSSNPLGPWFWSEKFARLLLFYFPLTGLLLVGVWRHLHDQTEEKNDFWRISIISLLIFFVLYSLVIPPAHFSRYSLFLMPFFFAWVAHGLQRLEQTRISTTRGVFALVGVVFLLAGVEFWTRSRTQMHAGELWRVMYAPLQREAFSKKIRNVYQLSPHKKPVSLACQEVQIKYWLDRHLVIRSLDGRVDGQLLPFIKAQGIDHVGYLKARRVDHLMHLPKRNTSANKPLLSILQKLRPGDSHHHRGIRFQRKRYGFALFHKATPTAAP